MAVADLRRSADFAPLRLLIIMRLDVVRRVDPDMSRCRKLEDRNHGARLRVWSRRTPNSSRDADLTFLIRPAAAWSQRRTLEFRNIWTENCYYGRESR